MMQMKDKKRKYRKADHRRKAAFCGRGFQVNSKNYQSIMNLTNQIIQRRGKICTVFLKQFEKSERNLRRRKYECQ